MTAANAILLACVIVLVVVASTLAIALTRRQTALRAQAGPEYDRLADEVGTRRARSEFARRRQRVAGLGIRPLTAGQRDAYDDQWTAAQARFIDSPPEAVRTAAELVASVAADRGYPVGDDSQFLSDLSVHHGNPLDGYRRARETTEQAEMAATEDLRQALLLHRAMFRELLGPARGGPARGTALRRAALGRMPAKFVVARSGR